MLDCESKTLLDQRATQPEKIFFCAARTTVGLACQCGEISACHSAGNNTKNKTEDGSPSLTSAGSHIPRARKYQPKFAKCLLIGVKVYFAAFSAQRDNWNPTASREKRIDKRRNILSDKSVNGLSPRADEATTPEENTTNPKMPTPRPLPSLVD